MKLYPYNCLLPEYVNSIGYACINKTLSKEKILTSRKPKEETFLKKGIGYIGEQALLNCQDLLKIIEWNSYIGIGAYRISSGLIPWMSEFELTDLPQWDQISIVLNKTGDIIKKWDMTIESHPGQWTLIASANENTNIKALKELEQTAFLFDTIGLPQSHKATINIHMGWGGDGNLQAPIEIFKRNFDKLSNSVQSRLALENDDKSSLFAPSDLYPLCRDMNIALTLDTFHHKLYSKETLTEAWDMSRECWNSTPLIHHSSSALLHEDPLARVTAHSDKIYDLLPQFLEGYNVMLEAKDKEMAIRDYCLKWLPLNISNNIQQSF